MVGEDGLLSANLRSVLGNIRSQGKTISTDAAASRRWNDNDLFVFVWGEACACLDENVCS